MQQGGLDMVTPAVRHQHLHVQSSLQQGGRGMATQLHGNVQSVLQQGGCDMATPAGLQPPLPPDQLYGHVQSDLQQ